MSLQSDLDWVVEKLGQLGYDTLRSRQSVPWLYGQNSGLVTFVARDASRTVVSFEYVLQTRLFVLTFSAVFVTDG